jgi:hypothetical protein
MPLASRTRRLIRLAFHNTLAVPLLVFEIGMSEVYSAIDNGNPQFTLTRVMLPNSRHLDIGAEEALVSAKILQRPLFSEPGIIWCCGLRWTGKPTCAVLLDHVNRKIE